MPAPVKVHLHFPTTNREIQVKKKIELSGGGHYVDDKAEIMVPLQPGMNQHGFRVQLRPQTLKMLQEDCRGADPDGEYLHINAEKGIQMKPGPIDWVAPDGRYYYSAKIQRDAQDLQAGRDPPKTDKAIIWLGIICVLLVIAFLIAAVS